MFRRENKFSQTPIGNIPKDWQVAKLGDITKINKESCDPSREFPENKFLYIDIESVESGSGRINEAKTIIGKNAPSRARRVVHKDDVLMSTVRPYLKAFTIVPNEFENEICSTGFAVLTSKEEMNPRYLLYSLFSDTVVSQCNRIMVGGQYPALRSPQVSEIKLPIPPMREQRGIVKILGVVDSAIELADKVIAKTARLKKGLMQQLLTRGIGHTEYQDTPIGKTPKTWTVIQLRDLISEVKNGFASGKRDENGIVQVRMNNITTDGRLVLDSYLKVPTPENMDMWLLKTDDFLFNNTNSIDLVGKSAIFEGAPFPCTFSNHFTRIRFKENLVRPELILYHFITQWEKGYFKSVAIRHVGQAAVHTEYLLRLRIPLPPLGEQKKIVEIISIASRKLELEREERTKLERIKSGLMDLLLTGKVRIKVD